MMDLRDLKTTITPGDIAVDCRAVGEFVQAGFAHNRGMDKYVWFAFGYLSKPEALGRVEPLDRGLHMRSFVLWI